MGRMFPFFIEPIERRDIFEQRIHPHALVIAPLEKILPLFGWQFGVGNKRLEIALNA